MLNFAHKIYSGFLFTNRMGEALGPLALRLLLAYEFWESGVMKFYGENWFADIQSKFLFPLNFVPVGISWFLATWIELVGAVALAVGFATRFFSLSLMVLTVVALVAVHAGHGYNVGSGGWKLPLIYLVLFVPLLLQGAGSLSLDRLIVWRWFRSKG